MTALAGTRLATPGRTGPQIATASVVQPWATPTGLPADTQLTARGGRPCLMTPAWCDAVVVSSTGEELPAVGQWTDDRRLTWRKFELPAPTRDGELGPVSEKMTVRLYSGQRSRATVTVSLEGALPRIRRDEVTIGAPANKSSVSDAPPPSVWRQAAGLARRMVGRHIELIARLTESDTSDPDTFHAGPTGGLGGAPVWPLERVLDMWQRLDDDARTRPPLIVHLSRTLPAVLEDVCIHPRRMLARQRRMQSAGQIHEVDAECLRWLAKQPGSTVAERAGAKQRAMGIARVEHADTLENRLVRDLLRRATMACQRFLSERGGDSGGESGPEMDDVTRIAVSLDRLSRSSPLSDVPPLAGLPRPNHVLQHDRRYKTLWKAYVQLVRRQVERDQAWRWRHRMWAEACSMAVLSAMGRISPRASAMHSDVLLRGGQSCGRFIDERSGLGRFDVIHGDRGSTVLMLSGDQSADYRAVAPFPDELSRMCPDAVLVCRDAQWPDKPPRHVMGLWTLLDFDLEGDELKQRAAWIDQGLRAMRSVSKLSGLLVQPSIDVLIDGAAYDVHCESIEVGACRGLRVTLPLQPHVETIREHLVTEFELTDE